MITYDNIYSQDYDILSRIMKNAFNDDTRMHTNLQEDGPIGYHDGSLLKELVTKKDYISQKISIDHNIIGAYTISHKEANYTLEMLFLDPNVQGKGIGNEVWLHIENTYSNARKWYVETPNYSIRNRYFYEHKCGFYVIKENVYENGEKSIIFMKEL